MSFGGAWGQNNQQQQQQQQQGQQNNIFGGGTGGFGQAAPPAFGAQQPAPAFGAQPQQQGGLFGNNTGGGGFGGFGASNTNTSTGFGQQQARPGFGSAGGAFGAPAPTFGSTFNQPTTPQNTQNPFGQPAGQTSTFGGGGGIFGAAKPAVGGTTGGMFGAAQQTGGMFGAKPAVAFGANAQQQNQLSGPVTQGSANPPFKAVQDKEQNGANISYQTITCMKEYNGSSMEEIRLQDYAQNRKDASAAAPAPAFGGFGVMGAAQQQPTGGLFGQPQQQPATGFGAAAAPSTGLFGSTTTNAFGAPATNTGFGQQPAQTGFGQPAASTGGLFGQQQQQQPTGGLFGQQQPAAGGFGQPAAAQTTGFGQPAGTTGFGGFGSTAAKPATTGFGFGAQPAQQPATGGLFGSTNNAAAPTGGLFGGGGFGQQNQQQPAQQQAAPTFGGFGATQTNTTGGFGATNTATGGGLFGGAAAKPATGFGAPAATGGGLFGSTTGGFGASNTAAPAAGTGFGQQPAAGASIFGQANTQAQAGASTGFGGFGAKPAGTGLFGSTQPAQNTQQPAPAFGGFGGANTTAGTGGSLFGNTLGQNQQANNSTGLFGASTQPKPAVNLFGGAGTTTFGNTSTSAPFGQQQPAQNAFGGFGQSALGNNLLQQSQQQQQQQPQQPPATIVDPFGAQSTWFAVPPVMPAVAPSANLLFGAASQSTSTPKALPPLASSLRSHSTLGKSAVRLRGLTGQAQSPSSPRVNMLGMSPGVTKFGTPGTPGGLFDAPSSNVINVNAFTPKASVKKLVLSKKITGAELNGAGRYNDGDRSLLNPDAEVESTLGGSVSGLENEYNASPAPKGSNAKQLDISRIAPAPKKASGIPREFDLDEVEHGEYYTIPQMNDLANASHAELSAVKNFVVGRKGWGKVEFLEPVDLNTASKLSDIPGKLVVFSPKICEVYPDGTERQEAGDGLNQPARITLEDIWVASNGERITDPSHKKVQMQERRMRSLKDTDFKSYDPATGLFVFEVQHFTAYGLMDDDDYEEEGEDFDDEGSLPRKRKPQEKPPRISIYQQNFGASHDIAEETESEGSSDEDMALPDDHPDGIETESGFDEELDGPGGLAREPAIFSSESPDEDMDEDAKLDVGDGPAPKILEKVDPHRLEAMRAVLFGSPAPTPRPLKRHLQPEMETPVSGSYFLSAGEEKTREFNKAAVERSSFGVTSLPAPRPRKYARVTLDQSITKGHEGILADAGLAIGRSFRLGWGPESQLLRLQTSETTTDLSAVGVVTVSAPLSDKSVEARQAQKLLNMQRAKSESDTDDNVPYFWSSAKLTFSDFANLFAGEKSHEADIWRLGRVLFDALTPTGLDSSPISDTLRKLSFSKWLASAVEVAVDRDLLRAEEGPVQVFAHLSGHRIATAVDAALKSGDMRLASLLSQLGGDAIFRVEMATQLETWRTNRALGHIGKDYRKLYALTAGVVDVLPGIKDGEAIDHCDDTDITEGLDWKRCLGLHLWYGSPFESSLLECLKRYQEHFSSSSSCAKPLPPHAETEIGGASDPPSDALYKLITLFADPSQTFETLLSPKSYSSSPFDVRIQWHLYQVYHAVTGTEVASGNDLADKLSYEYAGQLESLGLWVEAVFVLLHIEAVHCRIKAVKDLLFRRARSFTEENIRMLTWSYHVPANWIAEAEATCKRDDGDIYGEYLALNAAHLYDRAHEIAVWTLAPEAIVRHDMGLLTKLLAGFEDKAVEGWSTGARVLIRCAYVIEHLPKQIKASAINSSQVDARMLDEIKHEIPALVKAVPFVFPLKDGKPSTVEQMASVGILLEELYDLAGQLACDGKMEHLPVSKDLSEAGKLRSMRSRGRDSYLARLKAIK